VSRFSRGGLGLLLVVSGLGLVPEGSVAAPTAVAGGRVLLQPPVRLTSGYSVAATAQQSTPLGAGQILNVRLSSYSKGVARIHSCSAPPSSGKVIFSYDIFETSVHKLITDVNTDCMTATTDVSYSIEKVGDATTDPRPDRLQYVALAPRALTIEAHVTPDALSSLDFGIGIPSEAQAAVVVVRADPVPAPQPNSQGVIQATVGSTGILPCGDFPTFTPYPEPQDFQASTAIDIAYVPLETNVGTPAETRFSGLCAISPYPVTLHVTLLGWLSQTGPDTYALPPTTTYNPLDVRPAGLVAISPTRVLDTRNVPGPVGGKVFAGTRTPIDFGRRASQTVSSVLMNVTVERPETSGFITVYPCGENVPTASNLNFVAGQTVANAMTVKLSDSDNVCIFTSSTTQLIVDVMGGYRLYGGSGSQSVTPTRLLDTREAVGVPVRSKAGADSTTLLRVDGAGGVPASGATAVTLNVTVDQPESAGFVTVYPCGESVPAASNLNYAVGQTIANLVTVKVGQDGDVCFYTSSSTHLIADLSAWYRPSLPAGFKELEPVRILDSRNALGVATRATLEAGSITTLGVAGRGGVPITGAEAVTMNVTVDQPQGGGFITVFPCGQGVPTASNINFARGQTIANLVTVKLAADGAVCIFASASAHLLADVAGYTTTTPDTFWEATLTH
jgi:hypothetical protein